MRRALFLTTGLVAAACLLPDVPIVDSLSAGGTTGMASGGQPGSGGSSAPGCPAQAPGALTACTDHALGTLCYFYPLACECATLWVCTGCEQGGRCENAGQTCAGTDGQCACQGGEWACGAGGNSGGTAGSASGGSSGSAGTGGAAGSGGSAASAGSAGNGGSSGGSGGSGGCGATPSAACSNFCSGSTSIIEICADQGLHAEWDSECKCLTECADFAASLMCWQTHLTNAANGDATIHCAHALGAPGNELCDEWSAP